MKFETENPMLVKIIGASLAAVIFVGSTLVVGNPVVSQGLMAIATFLLGAAGVTVNGKSGQS